MRQGIPVLPTLLTSANLMCGIFASVLAINDALRLAQPQVVMKPFEVSAWLIIAAILLDTMDGLIARVTQSETKFGVEYDSMADLISFGVAPALLLYLSVLREYGRFGWIFVSIYIMCGAIRLARFNARKSMTIPKTFEGLPIPAAAGVLSSYVLLSMWGEWNVERAGIIFDRTMGWYLQHVSYYNQVVLPLAMVLVSLLMVSTLEYPRFRKIFVKGRVSFLTFVACSIILLFVILTPLPIVVFTAAVCYMGTGVITSFLKRGVKGVALRAFRRVDEPEQASAGVL